MNVLFSGYHNPHFLTVTEYIERGLETAGCRLTRFDDRQHLIPGRVRYRIKWLHHLDRWVLNQRLFAIATRVRPDVVIVSGGHRILPATVTALKRRGIRTVLWTTDAPVDFQPILASARWYDHILCQGTEAIELLERAGIHGAVWLPMACDPELHHPITLSEADKQADYHDVVFVGSYYPNRANLLETLTECDLGIWGPGWEQLPPTSWLKSRIRGAHTPLPEWRKIYSAAKIIVVIHYQDENNRFPVYQASPKIFEALACRAFVVSDNQKDVTSLFRDREHLLIFHNAQELNKIIAYYLHHVEERNAIAANGYKETMEFHTYHHRVRTLLSHIGLQSV